MLKTEIENTLHDMETVSQAFNISPFNIYLLGGTACILGNYTSRATMDFDFIDLQYNANLGKVFSLMRDFDMLDYETTILSPNYKQRAKQLTQFTYLNIYILSVEDIIISKIIRLEPKDIEDINILIHQADKALLNTIINEVLNRNDLIQSKKQGFINQLPKFKEVYNV